jgi:hypothetical protein
MNEICGSLTDKFTKPIDKVLVAQFRNSHESTLSHSGVLSNQIWKLEPMHINVPIQIGAYPSKPDGLPTKAGRRHPPNVTTQSVN